LEFYSNSEKNNFAPNRTTGESLSAETTGEPGTRRIRVLRIAHASLTPALRGRERAIVKNFPDVDMQVITPPRWKEAEMYVDAVDDEFFPVIKAGTFLSEHIQLFAYNPLPIIKVLRDFQPHIIDMDHEPYSIPCAEIITLRNLFAPAARIVMQTAQNINKRYPPPFTFLEKRAFRQVSAAYMCSTTVGEVLDQKNFIKPQILAPFGVDLKQFYPAQKETVQEDAPVTIGYIGRLLPAKGLLTLAAALAGIKSENWRLLIVGEGEQRETLKNKLASSGLLERTTFTGAVPYHETPDHFRKLDVLVVPTRTTPKIREQFGRVIIEAMACQVPVIGSTCGAIPEVIGKAGMIFRENDPQDLAEKLSKIIRNKNLREELALAGRERVEENYTWDSAARQIYSAYLKALEE
jgi:glycosyltransferase involved in cell wall biosynthesis